MSADERCETCKWYDLLDMPRSDSNDSPYGECKRHSPMVVLGQLPKWFQEEIQSKPPNPQQGLWPSVQWDDWCGEWKQEMP